MSIRSNVSDFLPVSVVTGLLLFGLAGPTEAENGWQQRMLFNPPASQLKLEKPGRIVIYDGLRDTQITQAMETQFDRVQSMMFVRTITGDAEDETPRDAETDTVVVEDDGC